MPPPISNY